MTRRSTGWCPWTTACVALSLVALLFSSPAATLAASNDRLRAPEIQVAPEENAPSIPERGGPIRVIQDRVPDDVGKATLPNATTDGALDLNFEACGFDDNIPANGGYVFIPPDPIGVAGMDRLIAVVNTMIECRTKGGHLKWRSGLADFFAPLTPKTFTFDPKIVHDDYANRFVVLALESVGGGGNLDPGNESRLLLAVSKDTTPMSATAADWFYYAIDAKTVFSLPAPFGMRDAWADYPGFEVDEEAIYVTANMFGFSPGFYLGVNLWIVDKGMGTGGFYDGGAASANVYDPYAGGGVVTTTMPAGIRGVGGVGGPGSDAGTFLVSYSGLRDGTGLEYVQVVSVSDPLAHAGGPYFVQEFIPVADIDTPGGLPDAPQAGSSELIEVNDRRALDAVWQDDTLWMTATTLPPSGPEAGETTAYWFALDTSGGPGATALADHGPIGGEDIAPGTYTFFPSVAVNAQGNVLFGFSASAPSIYAGAYAAGREVGDAAGTVQPALTIKAGEDWYFRRFGGSRNRWGDYSGICVDPEETDKFWVFNEFADTRGTPTNSGTQDGRWGTVWGRVKFLEDMEGAVVEAFQGTGSDVLSQNEPNPFNPMTRIDFVLPRDMNASLSIFNVRGQHVRTLWSGFETAGRHSVTWNGLDQSGIRVPSGAYIYRIEGEGISAAKRMIVLQ